MSQHSNSLCIENSSVFFALGAGAGALVSLNGPAAYALAGFSAFAAMLLPLVFLLKRPATPLVFTSFLLAGFFAFTSRSLGCADAVDAPAFVSGAATRFKAFIDTLPFGNTDTGALLKAFFCGDRSSLPRDMVTVFRKAGASHLLALSGLHIGIIYLIAGKVLHLAGATPAAKKLRYVTILAAAAFFTLMTGAGPSIVRAFLFIAVGETARLLHREAKLSRTLCTALLIQLALDPGAIRTAGFQLSYLALSGIAFIYPRLEGWFPGKGPLRYIWKTAALSISCQVFTAPLTLALFGTFPVHFLLTNLVAIPLTTALMAVGIAVMVLSGLGICPSFAYAVTDALCRALLFSLETVAAL